MASNYLHMTRSLNYCKYFATSRPHQESTTSRKIIKVNMQEIMDFKFKKGDDDKFGYVRMYTRKSQNGEVDIAIAMYNLDFKLSPKIVQYEKTTTFLGCYWINKDVETRKCEFITATRCSLASIFS